ncbi:MAG: undecaprenyl/decaprenyl-phosphate alpha-N-acetylglucosaminyl 1-phosphate transferase, partial [Gammaproteobacteria bacterium]|nr:undecaprenyl/decaprenyl-phosphate alpha-N-acetylglucosaminyl 1-phosphate transferase [Gammaproteobacteria bacterium]
MLTPIVALAITIFLVQVARRVAPAVGLIDSPCARKSHEGEIPLVGGIAIFGSLFVGMASGDLFVDHWPFLAAASLLVIVGVWDDVSGVSALVRLVVQSLALLIIAAVGGVYIEDLGNILPAIGVLNLGWMAIPFTVFAGVGAINAFNMSDGVDGVCGTLALVALAGLGVAAGVAGNTSEFMLIAALIGGVVGFLFFNVRLPHRSQASVFLGDAGSYLLGLAVMYLAIRLSQGPDRAIQPVTALWLCMLPLLDTIGMLLRRLRLGRSPFNPDREHIHHVFLLAKFSVTATWIGLTLVAVLGAAFGLLGVFAGIPDSVMFAGFLIISVAYYGMFTRVWKALTFLSRSINRRALAKMDRRVGTERRMRSEIYYVDGIPKERRSGSD